jgi:hypothetical protein
MSYESHTGKHAFMFTLGVVYASDAGTARQIAAEAGLFGREAVAAHAQLSADQQAAYRYLAHRDNAAMRAQLAGEVTIDPARTVTHPNGTTQVFATSLANRGMGEPAIGSFCFLPERGTYGTYAPDGSSLGDCATADAAYAAITAGGGR